MVAISQSGSDPNDNIPDSDRASSLDGVTHSGHQKGVQLEIELRQSLEAKSIRIPSLHLLFSAEHDTVFAITVRGKDALYCWEQLHAIKTETGFSPLIVGDRQDVVDLIENGLRIGISVPPQEILERRRHIDPREWLSLRFNSPERFIKGMWEELVEGEWSEEKSEIPISLLHDYREQIHEMATIVLIPTSNSLNAPAFLKFGNFNDCPRSEEHVALLKHWNKRYGIEVMGMNSQSMALRVKNPPSDRDEAYTLAKDLYTYTEGDGVNSQSRRGFASTLLNASVWNLWWD